MVLRQRMTHQYELAGKLLCPCQEFSGPLLCAVPRLLSTVRNPIDGSNSPYCLSEAPFSFLSVLDFEYLFFVHSYLNCFSYRLKLLPYLEYSVFGLATLLWFWPQAQSSGIQFVRYVDICNLLFLRALSILAVWSFWFLIFSGLSRLETMVRDYFCLS